MYFLMIRPQRRRMREQSAMQSELDVGDEVITTAGVYGFITGFDEDRIWLEIDDDVQVRISRAAIQGKVDTSGFSTEPKPPASGKSLPPADSTPEHDHDRHDLDGHAGPRHCRMTRRRLWASLIGCVGVPVIALALNLVVGNSPALGLDLQGGLSVVLAPSEGATGDDLIVIRDLVRTELENRGIAEPDVRVEGQKLSSTSRACATSVRRWTPPTWPGSSRCAP